MRLIIIAALACLAGCNQLGRSDEDVDAPEPATNTSLRTMDRRTSVMEWTDPNTRCRYLIVRGGRGRTASVAITPALRDGVPDCAGARKPLDQ
ncbi:MAG TPA: hypothetical protein VF695_01225 [Sphingomonas sp.]|jgi:hypothetical protein